MNLKVGDTFFWQRTFTAEDVRSFAHLTGDRGRHHLLEDEQGRLVVHGLLTASITTKIGGDLNYMARLFEMEFLRPVYTGDQISCKVEVVEITPQPKYLRVKLRAICWNQHQKKVLLGQSEGVIFHQDD